MMFHQHNMIITTKKFIIIIIKIFWSWLLFLFLVLLSSSLSLSSLSSLLLTSTEFVVFVESAAVDTTAIDANNDDNDPFVIGGYLPDYRSYINVNATSTHLTDLILFSIQPTLDNTNKCCLGFHHYNIAKKAKEFKKESSNNAGTTDDDSAKKLLKVWITIGGGGRTNELPQIMSNPTLRINFIQYIAELASKRKKKQIIDGIDFNFYHPKLIELNLLLPFLQEASKVWKSKSDQGLLISLALPPNVILSTEYYNIIDRVNLMTYDMIYTQGEYHSSLSNTKRAVQTLIQSGCPRSKIIVGIPAYGRDIINFQNVQTFAEIYDEQLFATTKINIDERQENNKNKEEWINRIQSSSSWQHTYIDDSNNNNNKMAWESPNLIKEKVDFAIKEERLGGIFIWELGQDKQLELDEDNDDFGYGGILLQSAANAVTAVTAAVATATTTTTSTSTGSSSTTSSTNDDGINKNEEEL